MSSKLLIFPILLALSLIARPASAETAEEMLAGCRLIANASVSEGQVLLPVDRDALKCWGAFIVFQEESRWVSATGREFDICTSSTSTRTALVAIFVAYVDKNPKRRTDNFVSVVLDSLRESFPCKTEPAKPPK